MNKSTVENSNYIKKTLDEAYTNHHLEPIFKDNYDQYRKALISYNFD